MMFDMQLLRITEKQEKAALTSYDLIFGSTIDADFGAIFGPRGFTNGSVTLDGVAHTVQLLDVPSLVFPANFIYQYSVTGTNRPATPSPLPE